MHKHPPSELTPEQQLAQIASILARGVALKRKSARGNEPAAPKEVPQSAQSDLEVDNKPRLSGSRRLGI